MSLREKLLERFDEAINKVSKLCPKVKALEQRSEHFVEWLVNALQHAGFKREIPGHEIEHTFRVLELSLLIGCFMNADLEKLAVATLLHDIGRWLEEDLERNHAEISADIAIQVLGNSDFSGEVAEIIREHSYSMAKKPSSIESAILQDADKIDALGVIGVARVFAYGGYKGRPIYASITNPEKTSYDHFFEKILKLPDLMNTELGKKIAEKRVKKIKSFLEEMVKEVELEDIKDLL